MPVGTPPTAERTGRDWLVIVPKWTLLCAVVVAAIAGLAWAMELSVGRLSTLAALGVCFVCLAALIVAWSEGGWARLFPPSTPAEDPAVRLAKRSSGYQTFIAIASSAALVGAGAALIGPRKAAWSVAVKLLLAGGAGLATYFRARKLGREQRWIEPEDDFPTSI